MKVARSLAVAGFGIILGLAGPLALTTLTACGGPGAKSAKVTPGDMPEGESWTGVYFHPVYGYLHMEEQDTNVRAKWKRADQSSWGELSGTKNGNVLHFTWKEYKSGVVARPQTGKGYFVYIRKPDMEQAELKGEYGLGADETGSEWNMKKQLRMTPDLKSIGGDTGSSTPTGGALD